MDPWIPLTFISRLLFYIAAVGSIGGYFIVSVINFRPTTLNDNSAHLRCTSQIKKTIFLACVLGIIAGVLEFLLLVGSFSDNGPMGMLDRSMIDILISTNAGIAAQYRVIVFLLAACFMAFSILKNKNTWFFCSLILWLFLSLSLSTTFSISGHFFEASFVEKASVVFHVFFAVIWLGSLYPLILICKTKDSSFIELIMKRFSQLAMVFVIALLVLGAALTYFLLGNWEALFFSNYGRGLLVKIFLIAMLLFFAARHKLRLVPKINTEGGITKLQSSITIELLIGLFVLVAVAALTSVIGTADMGSGH